MRAALLDSARHIVMVDVAVPEIQAPDQMLIQVQAVGICGSEVHAFDGTHPWRKAPVIMGHEMSGVVIAAGKGVSRFNLGDRVVVDPQWMCGRCPSCLAGDYNLCSEKVNMGTARWPGAFGEYICAPQNLVFHLPDELSFIQGAMLEPLSVAVHVAERTRISAGKSVAVLGSGSIGGMVSAMSWVRGASTIITADIHQHCLDVARERMGASHDFLLPDPDFASKVKQLTLGEGVDVAVVCADDVTLVNTAIEILKPRGVVALVALLTEAPLEFAAFGVIRKEIDLIGSYQGNHLDFRQAIELAQSGRVDIEGIVTHILPIEQAQRGCELASTKMDQAVKVVLNY
jgi:L-iditol 2-dehydrogenase